MSFTKPHRPHTLNGILLVALFSLAAFSISQWQIMHRLAISPLIIGILLGMIYANTLRMHLPKTWTPGIHFSSKVLLRVGIILFGFRVTYQQIAGVGLPGLAAGTAVATLTLLIGYFVGTRVFKLDRETAILTASGSAICGAAAVLATEGVLKSESYKSTVAVGTVVLFGTLSMFLYPLIYHLGIIPFDAQAEGIYIGSSIHEVAQVVGAGSAISPLTAENAVIVKMIRIMLLVPFLLILSALIRKPAAAGAKGGDAAESKPRISVPWFAIWFLVAAGVNSLNIIPEDVVSAINTADSFILTMAMTALGMESGIDKFKGVGLKAILLALVLFVWLNVGGYFIASLAVHL